MSPSENRVPAVDRITLFFAALAVVAGATLWWTQGGDAVATALGHAGGLLTTILPLVVLAVLMAAYVQRLLPMRLAERWLGAGSGARGLVLATAAGALTPGGPFSAFPLVVGLRGAGASLPVCITYLTAWSVLGVQRLLVWELPFLGADFAFLRLLVSVPLPLIAGAAATLAMRRLRE